ncbi:MAG: radical SAM protein [Candidatus Omnitrophica bacterium]|nr:radical SAM protein [Candidatus Omnitrophota bacterium]
MKVLLVRSNEFTRSSETNITGIYPPLGLAYIASSLVSAGHKAHIIDNQVAGLSGNMLKDKIKKYDPDIVLMSAMTPSWQSVVSMARFLKKVAPKIKIVVGGPHLTAYPAESLSEDSIDFGVYGEGEVTVQEAIKAIENGSDLAGMPGIIYRTEDGVIVNPPRKEIEDLDSVPFPAVEMLPYSRYLALSVKSPFFTIVTSRGCPYRCTFCYQGYLGRYRARSAENVVEEMELLVNKFKMKEIIIFDETFCVDRDRVFAISDMIRRKNLRFKWDFRSRVDLIDGEILKAVKGAGCSRIHLGIESGNQSTLDKMRKGITIPEIIHKVRLAKKAGLEVRGYFMLAYPGETMKHMLKTAEFAKSLPLDWASFTVTIGLPCTEIYKQALEEKTFELDYWREYTKGNTLNARPYFTGGGLDENDIFALKRRAYLKFYLRPRSIANLLKCVAYNGIYGNLNTLLKVLPRAYSSAFKRAAP